MEANKFSSSFPNSHMAPVMGDEERLLPDASSDNSNNPSKGNQILQLGFYNFTSRDDLPIMTRCMYKDVHPSAVYRIKTVI